MRRTKIWLPAAAISLALVVAGCGGGEGGDDPDGGTPPDTKGGSFSVSSSEPEAFAPTSACYSSDCSQIIDLVFTGLLRTNPETQEQELLMAESIETEDSQNYTITIKEGFTFHNGEPVTAQSFVDAWNYTAYGPNATQLGFFFSKVEGYDDLQGEKPKAEEMTGLTAPDDLTIEVALTEPFSQFASTLSYTPAAAPIAKECMDDIKACNEQPIGNGPYQFAGPWNHNQSIALERYPDYSDDATAGNADAIEFKIYADLKTAYRDYQGGNLDIVAAPDPSQVPQARAQYPDQILEVDSGSFSYIGFPFYEEAYQDVRIRQALSLAIDRQAIIDRVLFGRYIPALDVISPFVPGSREDACATCVYDAEEAKRLYDEAGGLPNDELTLYFNNDGGHEDWTQAVAQGWKEVLGVETQFESQPFTPYLNQLGTQSEVKGPYRLGWLPDYPSAQNYLDPIYGEGSSNYGKWEGPEHEAFLDLVNQGDQTADAEEAVSLYQEAADVVLENQVVIPLWFGQTFVIFSENVDNVAYSPTNQLLLADVTASS